MRARATFALVAVVLACATLGAVPGGGTVAAPAMVGRIDFSPSAVPFPVPGISEFDAGWVYASQTLGVRVRGIGRTDWRLWIRADGTGMGNGKTLSDIQFRAPLSGGWQDLSGVNQPIDAGRGNGNVPVEFRIRLDWASDGPGGYSGDITFELSVP
jgi:hypothetical protein